MRPTKPPHLDGPVPIYPDKDFDPILYNQTSIDWSFLSGDGQAVPATPIERRGSNSSEVINDTDAPPSSQSFPSYNSDAQSLGSNHSRTSSIDSVFTSISLASSTTSRGSYVQSTIHFELIDDLTSALFVGPELNLLFSTALDDQDISDRRLQRNTRRLIQRFGKNLRFEAKDKKQSTVAKVMRTGQGSNHAADKVISLVHESHPKRLDRVLSARKGEAWDEDADESEEAADESDRASSDESEEEDIAVAASRELQEFLINSNAYSILKTNLLDFVHKPYEKRIRTATGSSALGEMGTPLEPGALKHVAREVSWAPLSVITLAQDETDTVTNRLKTAVETHIGLTWDWWPLSARQPPVLEGYHRVRWPSPCGSDRHLDIPQQNIPVLLSVFASAPRFMQQESQTLHRYLDKIGLPGKGAVRRNLWRGPYHLYRELDHLTGHRLYKAGFFSHNRSLPESKDIPHMTTPKGQDELTENETGSSTLQSSESNNGQPSPNSGDYPGRRKHTEHERKVYIYDVDLRGRSTCNCVYLCTRRGDSYRPSCIEGDTRQTDRSFFRDLRKQYIADRGFWRHYLSIWRFDHCEFYRVSRSQGAQ